MEASGSIPHGLHHVHEEGKVTVCALPLTREQHQHPEQQGGQARLTVCTLSSDHSLQNSLNRLCFLLLSLQPLSLETETYGVREAVSQESP